LKNQIYLGNDQFVEETQRKISPEASLQDVPAIQKRKVPKPLPYYEEKDKDRNVAICKAYASGGYSMHEIGKYFGLHYSRVSRIVNREAKKQDLTLYMLHIGSGDWKTVRTSKRCRVNWRRAVLYSLTTLA